MFATPIFSWGGGDCPPLPLRIDAFAVHDSKTSNFIAQNFIAIVCYVNPANDSIWNT